MGKKVTADVSISRALFLRNTFFDSCYLSEIAGKEDRQAWLPSAP